MTETGNSDTEARGGTILSPPNPSRGERPPGGAVGEEVAMRISGRAVWQQLVRGFLLYGAGVGGSLPCYEEWLRRSAEAEAAAAHWDWSIPHRWYDVAHGR
ncbi:hypothetical protein NFA_43880 [Nocardia farcinica IFM 10152]|uniref:Uncharacterized protein n=2 Tax=Nocardia farcinica TaxID=37329 RepID=Q5YRF4_NOCFA|nr:hypothetical protein NFA_43880 [Nocardia farcinica IFM 10152]